MASYSSMLSLLKVAESRGFSYDRTFEPIMARGDRIIGKTHYRVMYNPAFLEALFGGELVGTGLFNAELDELKLPAYWFQGTVLFDMAMDRSGDPVEYLVQEVAKTHPEVTK